MNISLQMMARLMIVGGALFAVAVVGCRPASDHQGKSPSMPPTVDSSPSGSTSAPPAAASATAPPSTAASTPPWDLAPAPDKGAIIGRISYDGDPPKPKLINFGPEKKCHDAHTSPPTDETLVVAQDKSIRWVLVHLTGDVPGDFPPPSEPAVLDQKGCIFIPHVMAVRAGQPILVLNSDEVAHNVRCEATRNPAVNFVLPTKGGSRTIQFDEWDIGMKLKCDIHFWMNGFIHAMRHPFYYVTDADGWFKIENVPPGTYKLQARHEKLGRQNQDVEVKAGEISTVHYVFASP